MEYNSIVNTVQYGKFVVCLDEVLKQKKVSKTKLAKLANTNYKNIKRLCDLDVQRIDLDILARVCFVLGCDISDVVRYEGGECEGIAK